MYELGPWRATYRDYPTSPASICSAEPRWLEEELQSVNSVLAQFLDRTGTPADEPWSSRDLDLLQEGMKSLPPVLRTHERNLQALADCGFADRRGLPILRQRGLEYVADVRERLKGAPALLEYLAAKRSLERWRREQPSREYDAKATCPEQRKRRATPEIYYAYEAETGQVRWLFCNGAQVVTAPSSTLEFRPPVDASRRELRRLKAKDFLQAAREFPNAQIDRPPALPPTDIARGGKDDR